jgi:hypothetical protein
LRRPGTPLFLQRGPYRRRRRIDAARLLPVFGVFLLILPILWGPAEGAGGGRSTSGDALYLFAVWAGLIGIARALAPGLAVPDATAREQTGETGEAGEG